MRSRSGFLMAVAAGALVACQPYQVDPVRPATAKIQKKVNLPVTQVSPNVVFVIDHSGSMTDPAGSDTNGQSKWQDLVQVMAQDDLNLENATAEGFVADLVGRASVDDPMHVGMVVFPSDATCGAGGRTLDPTTNDPAGTISTILNGFAAPTGGTPTASSLIVASQALSTAPQDGRPNYLVLMTDGAPNCNDQWAQVTGNAPSMCQINTEGCVSGCCYNGNTLNGCATPNGCLDANNLVATIDSLAKPPGNVGTFVIGFGTDVSDPSSAAYQTLDQSAIKGGFPQDGEPRFYSATSRDALAAALNAIMKVIDGSCDFQIDGTPVSPDGVEVEVTAGSGDPVTLTPGADYTITSDNKVELKDTSPWCTQIKAHDPNNPITVTVSALAQ